MTAIHLQSAIRLVKLKRCTHDEGVPHNPGLQPLTKPPFSFHSLLI